MVYSAAADTALSRSVSSLIGMNHDDTLRMLNAFLHFELLTCFDKFFFHSVRMLKNM